MTRVPTTITFIAAAVLTLAAPALAGADVSPVQAIRYLNEQRAANGIPPLKNERRLASWCPDEDRASGAADSAYTDWNGGGDGWAWGLRRNPWSPGLPYERTPKYNYGVGPLHELSVLDPLYSSAGFAHASGIDCVGLSGARAPARPRAYAAFGPAGPSHVPTLQYVMSEGPFAPQQCHGIPERKATGPNLYLYTLGMGGSPYVRASVLRDSSGRSVAAVVADSRCRVGGKAEGRSLLNGAVITVRHPIQPGRYSGRIIWSNGSGKSLRQSFTFTAVQS